MLSPDDLPWGSDPAVMLAELLDHRPDWHRDAACKEHPEVDFFAGTYAALDAAVDVCGRCLVRSECREAGMDEPAGVWGGLTPEERRRLRAERAADAAAEAGRFTAASVIALRAEGLTWAAVGAAVGISRQRAHQLGAAAARMAQAAPGEADGPTGPTAARAAQTAAQAPPAAA